MSRRLFGVRLFTLLVVGACTTSELPVVDAPVDTYVPMTEAQRARSFEQIVMPLVTECVGNGACHRGQPPLLTSYADLTATMELELRYTAKPGVQNILVTKGGADNTHQGVFYFSSIEKVTIAEWIDSL